MPEYRYLSAEDLIHVNVLVLREIKARKADRPQLLSRSRLDEIVAKTAETKGDVYDKATALTEGLVQLHPFASGNRRTALVATKLFLEANGYVMRVVHDPKVLQGIREGFYTKEEVKSWLKGNAIEKFAQGQE